jgi:Holliday junction resolvasome RuvABC endonuclease subunit
VRSILGLDLSLAKTGLAALSEAHGVWEMATRRIVTKPHGKGNTRGLRDRMGDIREQCSAAIREDVELAVLEGPSFASVGGSSKDLMGLWWLVYDRLCEQDLPVLVVPPSSLKKWATGKGNAGKGQVAVGISRTFPMDRFLVDFAQCDDNEVDAAALCGIGAQHLGWDVPISRPGYRDQVLATLRTATEEAA